MATKQPKNHLSAHKPEPGAVMAQAKFYSGPLPAPQDLAHYEQISPGAANRIIAMAEAQVSHRIAMEQQQLNADIEIRSKIHQTEDKSARTFYFIDALGQSYGWVLSMACVAGAVYTGVNGAPWQVPVALVSLPVVAMIKALRGNKGSDKQTSK